jgi:V8-like Glu-specific endopeptidase
LHQGKLYFGVEAMGLWECNHSCWNELGNSGAPILDSHGYCVGMHLSAYLPHQYMARTEGVRVFIEGLNVQGIGGTA